MWWFTLITLLGWYNTYGYCRFGLIKIDKKNNFWNDEWNWSRTDEIQKVPTKPRPTRKSKPKTTNKTQKKKRSAPVKSKNKKFNNSIEAIRNDIKTKIENNNKNRISDNYNAIKMNNIISKDIVLEK